MSPVEVLGAAEGAGASRRGARAKLKKKRFLEKKLSDESSELRVATHIYGSVHIEIISEARQKTVYTDFSQKIYIREFPKNWNGK